MPSIEQRLAPRIRPDRQPVLFQRWSDLLFLHWEIDAAILQGRLPEGLTVDCHEGKAYLGVVPFFMERVRPRGLPAVPWLSNFLELNVRTYVYDDQGRPGVWFFSLDCDQAIAVEVARHFFHLPYQHAAMSATRQNREVRYQCRRKNQTDHARYHYQIPPELKEAEPGSLEFFLLERYLLFSQRKNEKLSCGQVHHRPYRYAPLENKGSSLPLSWEGFQVEGNPVSSIVSPGVPVEIFGLQKAR